MEINLAELVKNNLTADEYVWLHQKYYGTNLPVVSRLDKTKLQNDGWVKVLPDQIVLRQKTRNMFEQGDYIYEEHKPDSVTITGEVSKVKDWIEEYRELFPLKTVNGRLLRATPSACIKKMESFIKNNSTRKKILTKDIILEATKSYLNDQKRSGYLYTKAANYFINKEQDSMLLQCIEVLNSSSIPVTNGSDGTNSMTEDI